MLATRDFQSWTYFCKEATYPGFLIVMQGILLILILLGVDLTVLARRIENLFCSDGFVNMKANHINQFIQVQYGVHLGPCAASLLFTFPPHSRIMSPFVLFGDKTFPICSLRIISAGGFFWFNEVVLSIHRWCRQCLGIIKWMIHRSETIGILSDFASKSQLVLLWRLLDSQSCTHTQVHRQEAQPPYHLWLRTLVPLLSPFCLQRIKFFFFYAGSFSIANLFFLTSSP